MPRTNDVSVPQGRGDASWGPESVPEGRGMLRALRKAFPRVEEMLRALWKAFPRTEEMLRTLRNAFRHSPRPASFGLIASLDSGNGEKFACWDPLFTSSSIEGTVGCWRSERTSGQSSSCLLATKFGIFPKNELARPSSVAHFNIIGGERSYGKELQVMQPRNTDASGLTIRMNPTC